MSQRGCHSKVQRSKFNSAKVQGRFLPQLPERSKTEQIHCSVLSCMWMSVGSSLLSLPPFRARPKLRLPLSVWRAGCENVAASTMHVCACVCDSLNACAPPPPLSSEGERTSALNSPLTPPPSSFSLYLSASPSPYPPLPPFLLSADINTQGTAAKIPGKVVKILSGY